MRNLRSALLAAALAAGTAVTAAAADASAAIPVHSASGQPAPGARHSGHVVPGLTGAALRRVLPADVSRRFSELNAYRHGSTPTVAYANAAGRAARLTPWTGWFHSYWGTFPGGVTLTGAQATQSLNPSARVVDGPSGLSDYIYAPTLDPSGIDCVEMSTIYFGGRVEIGAWDWCAANPTYKKTAVVNSAFLSTYTTKVKGQTVYSVRDVQTRRASNQWTSYLYNYRKHRWDWFYQSANTSKLRNTGGGWDMMEVYTYFDNATGEGQYCSQTRGAVFQTTGLRYQTSFHGRWIRATTRNSHINPSSPRPSDLGCSHMNYAVSKQDTAFGVINRARKGRITGFGGLCVDDRGARRQNFNPVQIYTCNGTNAQRWTVNYDTIRALGKCLDIAGGGTADGTKVDLYHCNGTGAQAWQPRSDKSLYNPQSGKCLDDTNWSTTSGTQLQIWDCVSGQADQQWTLPN